MTKKKTDWRIVCTGIVCVTVLEAIALAMGYNGTLLKGVLIVIALAIGITIPKDAVISLLKKL